jgi:hypothetical protein
MRFLNVKLSSQVCPVEFMITHVIHPKRSMKTNTCKTNKRRTLVVRKKPKCWKSLFIGAKVFIHVTKKGDTFLIYVLPMSDVKSPHHEIPSQYKEFKDVFEKIIVDTLFEHCPYDCTIDFEEGSQSPFGPIHNLSQDELITLHKYIEENFEKRFIQHYKSLVGVCILFVKKKDGSL